MSVLLYRKCSFSVLVIASVVIYCPEEDHNRVTLYYSCLLRTVEMGGVHFASGEEFCINHSLPQHSWKTELCC